MSARERAAKAIRIRRIVQPTAFRLIGSIWLLATRCPFCETVFRLQTELLALRRGLVRCGHCQEVFDASSSLFDISEGGDFSDRQTGRRCRGDRSALGRASQGPRLQRRSMGSVGTVARRRHRQPSASQRRQCAALAGLHRRRRRGHAAPRYGARTRRPAHPPHRFRRRRRTAARGRAARPVRLSPRSTRGSSAARLAQDRARFRRPLDEPLRRAGAGRAAPLAWHS